MVNLVIALKNQVTQMIQLVTNQVDMQLHFNDTAKEMALVSNQLKLMKNCLQIELLTNQVGAAQTKKTVPTVAKTKALAAGVCAAQQNEYDTNAGPKLMMAARSGDALWDQRQTCNPISATLKKMGARLSTQQPPKGMLS
jgi:hypothetical protein